MFRSSPPEARAVCRRCDPMEFLAAQAPVHRGRVRHRAARGLVSRLLRRLGLVSRLLRRLGRRVPAPRVAPDRAHRSMRDEAAVVRRLRHRHRRMVRRAGQQQKPPLIRL